MGFGDLFKDLLISLNECADEINNARNSDDQSLRATINDTSKSKYERAAAAQELKRRDDADIERRIQALDRREQEAERWKKAEAIRRQRQQNK